MTGSKIKQLPRPKDLIKIKKRIYEKMISSSTDILKFIDDKSFKKIFILCGRNSFFNSGAENLIKKLNHKETRFFYKKSEIPILEELIEIINEIKSFKPDLFLAIGGGAIIDYAKMANVVDNRPDLSKLIVKLFISI